MLFWTSILRQLLYITWQIQNHQCNFHTIWHHFTRNREPLINRTFRSTWYEMGIPFQRLTCRPIQINIACFIIFFILHNQCKICLLLVLDQQNCFFIMLLLWKYGRRRVSKSKYGFNEFWNQFLCLYLSLIAHVVKTSFWRHFWHLHANKKQSISFYESLARSIYVLWNCGEIAEKLLEYFFFSSLSFIQVFWHNFVWLHNSSNIE